MSKAFCFVPVHAGIYTKGINQFMQKMSFLWNVYCGYFNSGLSRSLAGSLVRCAPSYEGTLVNAPIACEIFRCIVIQTRAEWVFFYSSLSWSSSEFGFVSLFLAVIRIILVGGKMNVCLLPLFTERIQTHLDTQIHNFFCLAGAGAGAVLSVASVIYDAIRFLLGQQIAKHQTS